VDPDPNSLGVRIDFYWLNPDPDWQKLPTKKEKNEEIFCFAIAGCSLLRTVGFSYSLDVRHGGMEALG
jgi:hypothetical protein